MTSRVSRLTCFALALSLALGSIPAFAQVGNAPLPRRPKVIAFSAAENVKELYVAIMGEVVNPGTYHVDPSALNLHSIVKKAGGFTADATKTIRVIRQGQLNHQESYSETVNSFLLPGDLLIVDSRPINASSSQVQEFVQEPTTIHASYQERVASAGVQIALLNVQDYPIVLRLRPDEANTVNIIENLGQPLELLANTKVISPDITTRSSADQGKFAIRLAGGSAVVFDRGTINRSRLPATLPKPIESEIALGAQSGLIGGSLGQSPELMNLGQRAFNSSNEASDFNSQVPLHAIQESLPSSAAKMGVPTEDLKNDLQPPVVSTRPRIANVPFTGTPRITNSSTETTQADSVVSEPIPQPDDSTIDSPSSSPMTGPSLSIDEPIASPSSFSGVQLLALLLVVGALIGAAVILRRTMDSNAFPQFSAPAMIPLISEPEIAAPMAKDQSSARTLLELLIKNELPIAFEAVEFPSELTLQGRIVAKPILRVDEPQNVLKQNGPHFETSEHQGGYSLQQMTAQLDTPDVGPVRRPHFMGAEKPKVAVAAKSSQEPRELPPNQVGERSNAPLANALFELEQGGRS